MENPEEILHSLEEFSKLRPKSIPRELEEYLCFVAKTGDPVYQWSVIKCLFREKLINVITEFYESCPSVSIPSCRNVDIFNYDTMKTFILEKLDTFVAAPFTVQRICELLTTPRKEYNRIDKYMRALEKNILVVSTTEPGNHRTPENGDGFINGIESDHVQDGSHDINIEEMDDAPIWPVKNEDSYQSTSKEDPSMVDKMYNVRDNNIEPEAATSQTLETVICSPSEDQTFVPIAINSAESEVNPAVDEEKSETELQVANEENTEAVPAVVQRRRTSIEPPSEQTDETQPSMPIEETNQPLTCPESEIQLDKPEISLDLPESEHLPHGGDSVKDILPEEPKEEPHIPEIPTLDMAAAGDAGLHTVIESPRDPENIELSEQAEIDVTSFASTKPDELPLPVDIPEEVTQPMQESVMPMQEQETDPEQVEIHRENQDHTQITLPQAETPIDIPQTDTLLEPQEAVIGDEPTECREPIDMDNLVDDVPHTSEQIAPSISPPITETQEDALVEPAEENSSIHISNEQKALETMVQPDIIPEVVDDVLPVVDSTLSTNLETAMEVDTPELPCVEDAPNDSTDSADSNN